MNKQHMKDAVRHKNIVNYNIRKLINLLVKVGADHDNDKILDDTVFDCYTEVIPALQATEYGSAERQEVEKDLIVGWEQHIKNNRHHFTDLEIGVNYHKCIDFIDYLEVLIDWVSAMERNKNMTRVDIRDGVIKNCEKYKFSEEITDLMIYSFDRVYLF